MATVVIDPTKVREFVDATSFNAWLSLNHDVETEVWIKIYKVKSGRQSISVLEAIDVVLCWGWIDAIKKGLDDTSFLQRYTRRGPKSTWSQINVDNIARLIADGRMTEFGLSHVEAAKNDGRWDRAYKSGKNLKIPDDLQAAIDLSPLAREMFGKLNERNRFALAFRAHNLKTAAGRIKAIDKYVTMLERGEAFYPQRIRSSE